MSLMLARRFRPRPGGGGGAPVQAAGFQLFGPEAGGYLTGLNFADDGTAYTRADVGGAYRKAPGQRKWTQVLTTSSVTSNAQHEDFQVDAIACCPTQSQHVYIATGANYTGGKIMRSTNSGATWTTSPRVFQVAGNGEHRYAREPLAVQHDDPLICYYASRREGLWRTTDGAASWTQLTALPDQTATDYNRTGVTIILIERGSALVGGIRQGLWAAVNGRGVYRSTNGGSTWTLMHTLATGSWVRDAVLDSNGHFVCTVSGVTVDADTVMRITPAGAVTKLGPQGSRPIGTITVHPTDPLRIWVGWDGLQTQKWWRSTNGGTSWTPMNVSINNGEDGAVWPTTSDLVNYMSTGQIKFDPSEPTRMWFAEGMGMWHSTDFNDADTLWTFASDGIQELVANAIVKPPGKPAVAVTWDRGVWKWDAQGKATLPYTGIFCSAWDVQARPDAPDVMAATVSDHQSGDTNASKRLSAITLDGGSTWTRLAGLANGTTEAGLRFGTIAIARGSSDRLVWAPSYEDTAQDITGVPLRYSADRGATWQTPTVAPAMLANERITNYKHNKQRVLVADPLVNDKFYALSFHNPTGTSYLLTSTDGGATWTRQTALTAGNYEGAYGGHLAAVADGSTTVLLYTPGPRGDREQVFDITQQIAMRRSRDGGATWQTIANMKGASCLGVGAPISPSTKPTIFTYGMMTAGRKALHRSSDLGDTWTEIVDTPLGWHQGVSALAGDPEIPGKVYVGLPGGSFFVGQAAL